MPWVDNSKCKGCHMCLDSCPVDGAISAKNKSVEINQEVCSRCGICLDTCPEGAIRPNSENPSIRGQKPFGAFSNGQSAGRGLGRPMSKRDSIRNKKNKPSGSGGGFGRNTGGGRGRR
ncbi:MAG: DUF362 domain-containing protein [Candidatus Zixiibacteriota bacterium]